MNGQFASWYARARFGHLLRLASTKDTRSRTRAMVIFTFIFRFPYSLADHGRIGVRVDLQACVPAEALSRRTGTARSRRQARGCSLSPTHGSECAEGLYGDGWEATWIEDMPVWSRR